MTELEQLTKLIAETRHPKTPDAYVHSEEIAEAILMEGYTKKPIAVKGRMVNEALLKFFPGISSVSELKDEVNVEQRMANAIYAAWIQWKNEIDA